MSLYALYLRKSRSDDPEKSVEETLRRHREILDKYAIENGSTLKPRISMKKLYPANRYTAAPRCFAYWNQWKAEPTKAFYVWT